MFDTGEVSGVVQALLGRPARTIFLHERFGRDNRAVHRVVRQVEEPRPVAPLVDETDRLVGETRDSLVALARLGRSARDANVEAVMGRRSGFEPTVVAVAERR